MVTLRCGQIVERAVLRRISTMSSSAIRQTFIEYFEKRDHIHFPSSSVLPLDDPTLLFVNAGMNQFKSVFLGKVESDSVLGQLRRVVNCQKCIRAGGKSNDLETVGKDTTHHTFFEMLGNWSFGDYYKQDACQFAWDFLINSLHISPNRLYVTYFGGDESLRIQPDLECRDIWLKIGVPASRILPFQAKDNFWSMGETGPCGTCSEIHYDFNAQNDARAFVNKDGSPVVEIWNLVFMEYNRDQSGRITRLPKRHIDTGMGLERISAVLQNVRSNYDTDIFRPLIEAVEKFSNVGKYTREIDYENKKNEAYRIIVDHLRACCVGFAEGVVPSSTGRGFVLRQMLRRATLVSQNTLGAGRNLLQTVLPYFIDHLKKSFPDLNRSPEAIYETIETEELRFWDLVDRGTTLVEDYVSSGAVSKVFPGDVASHFWLSHGVPLDITKLVLEEKGLVVDNDEFEECLEKNMEKSLLGSKKTKGWYVDVSALQVLDNLNLPTTDDHFKYNFEKGDGQSYVFPAKSGKIVAILDKNLQLVDKLEPDEFGCMILTQTCFYAEEGGQTWDTGIMKNPNGVTIFNVQKVAKRNNRVIVFGTAVNEALKRDMTTRRISLMRNHTASHLLLHALRYFFGLNAFQKSSSILPDRFRLSCTLSKLLSPKQVDDVQKHINKIIRDGKPVVVQDLTFSDVKKLENLQTSLETYMLKVAFRSTQRVVSIGDVPQSHTALAVECCCGTHVSNTSEIGMFQIVSQKMTGVGVCRLDAVTGDKASEAQMNARALSCRIASLNSSLLGTEIPLLKDALRTSLLPWISRVELRSSLKKAVKRIKKETKLASINNS